MFAMILYQKIRYKHGILYPYVTFGEVFLKFFAKLFRNVLLLTRTITDAIWNPCHIATCCIEQQFHCYGVSLFDFDQISKQTITKQTKTVPKYQTTY